MVLTLLPFLQESRDQAHDLWEVQLLHGGQGRPNAKRTCVLLEMPHNPAESIGVLWNIEVTCVSGRAVLSP